MDNAAGCPEIIIKYRTSVHLQRFGLDIKLMLANATCNL